LTKQELRQYRAIQREMRQITESLTQLRDQMENPAVPVLSHTPKAKGRYAGMANLVAEALTLEQMYYQRLWAGNLLLRRIEQAIDSLDDTGRTLMRARYILGYTWPRIASDLGYDIRHVHRLHGKILRDLKTCH